MGSKASAENTASKVSEEAMIGVLFRNLPNRAREDKILSHIEKVCGFKDEQVRLELPLDRRTRGNKGFAFVMFESEEAAKTFIRKVEGTQIEGSETPKRLTAVLADPTTQRVWEPAYTQSCPR